MSYLNLNVDAKRIAIIGSRNFYDKEHLYKILDKNKHKIKLIISGGARGADELGRQYAQDKGLPILIFYPRWYDENGIFQRGAGFSRNREIISRADVVLCWWDNQSKGTANSLEIAKQLNKPVKIFLFTPEIEEPPEIVKSDELKTNTEVISSKEAISPIAENVEKNETQFPKLEKTEPPINPSSLLDAVEEAKISLGDSYDGVDETL